jgi:hypothetical protein
VNDTDIAIRQAQPQRTIAFETIENAVDARAFLLPH